MQRRFNPNSSDAMFATIIQRLDQQDVRFDEKAEEDREAFKVIMARQDITNGRVNKLDAWRKTGKAKMAVITFLISVFGAGAAAWAVDKFNSKP